MIRSSLRPAARGPRCGPARRGPRRLLAAGVCALGLLLSACGSDSGSAPSAMGTPKHGGEITFSLPSDVISFDPARSSFENVTDGSRLSALYDVLLWTDPATGTLRPQMAESMTYSDPDARNWVLRLRPGIKFSDGTPLDAEAVRFNWERYKSGLSSGPAVRQVESMAVADNDPLQLNIKLSGRNANFDRTVSKNLNFIGSPQAIKAGGPAGLHEKPVGAGPFVFERYEKGKELVLRRNENYWQRDKGLPYLDRVTFVPEIDIQRSIQQVRSKDVDMTMTVDPFAIAQAKKHNIGTQELTLNGGAMVLFNSRVAPFNNVEARQAVAYALDSTEINDSVYGGSGTPARGLFNSLSPLANIQLAAPSNNPKEAARLFDKVTQNGTKKLEFTYVVPSAPLTVQMAQLMQSKLNSYRGVTMHIQSVTVVEYVSMVRAGQNTWQAAVGQQWIDDPEPLIYELLRSDSSRNNSGINNKELDKALDSARATTDPQARRDAYTKVQLILNREMPFWVYQEAVGAAVFRTGITNVQLFNDGLILWDRIGLRKD